MSEGVDRDDPAAAGRLSTVAAVLEALAFVCELAMLVVLGVAGWGLGSGGLMGIAFMIFYPALAILIWSLWMAPRSSRRLGDPGRLIAQLALFAGTAGLAAAGGHPVLGIVFGVVAALVFAGTRLTGRSAGG